MGSQSIVSLINLSLFNKTLSSNKSMLAESPEDKGTSSTKVSEQSGMNGDGEEEEDARELEKIQAAALVEEDESPENTTQSVRVDADPAHICLSATNFDQCLIDYLQMHPITKRF
jgi:hypothetical protein